LWHICFHTIYNVKSCGDKYVTPHKVERSHSTPSLQKNLCGPFKTWASLLQNVFYLVCLCLIHMGPKNLKVLFQWCSCVWKSMKFSLKKKI
jgi:hypothetical protein